MRITVSVTNDLSTDQRVHKVCTTLAGNGYDVMLIGRRLRNSLPVGRRYRTKRLRLLFSRSVLFYAEYNIRLFFYLLFVETDVFLSNDTDTLPANYLVSLIRRKPLVFDAHEMFPELPEITDRWLVKAIWTKIEDLIFPRIRYSYTVCRSVANIYNERYGMTMQVVRNIPLGVVSALSTEKPIDACGRKVILYQGSVNVGRGIERVIDAMPYLDGFIFYVIGDGDVLEEMRLRVERRHLSDRVIFTGRLPFERLLSYTSCADVGVNLLENRGLNYYYSLPNRIFDFMRVGVPVLSSDFPEIRNIVAHYGTGKLISHYEPEYIASTILGMVDQPVSEELFAVANVELTWENEVETVLRIFREVEMKLDLSIKNK